MKKLKETVFYESSTVALSSFDYKTNELIVEFNSGAAYSFSNVTIEDYESFRDSDSIGKSFNQYIRQYGGLKIEEKQNA